MGGVVTRLQFALSLRLIGPLLQLFAVYLFINDPTGQGFFLGVSKRLVALVAFATGLGLVLCGLVLSRRVRKRPPQDANLRL